MGGTPLPSLSLLAQSALSGVFIGALYGLLGLGLSLGWGLLRQINLAHFGFAFLGAYCCYQLTTVAHWDPLATLAVIVPALAALGVGLHAVMQRYALTPFASLLMTFGVTGFIEAGIQWFWSADYRKLASGYGDVKFTLGGLFVPLPELLTLLLAALFSFAIWALLRFTDLGKALRACAEDVDMAAAFGINASAIRGVLAGICASLAGVAGVCVALTFSLAPSQIYAWIGVVFATVMLGGLGSALGPLVAGMVIGVSEALTMAVTAPSWAPTVSFTLLIAILLLRPGRTQ
jgi:branched-chain amino acid transport system permease protein